MILQERCWMRRGRQRNFNANKIIAYLQHCRVESVADLLSNQGTQQKEKNAMAEKWKEILQSQKDAPSFIKWSADDEKNCRNSPQSQSL